MAQFEAASKTIDGDVFRVHKLDPRVSYRLSRRLGAVLAPTIGAAIGKADTKNIESAEIDFERGAAEFFARLDEKLLDDLIEAFGVVSFVNDKPLNAEVFQVQFRGKIGQMYAWLFFCISSEYEDILKKVRSGIGQDVLARLLPLSKSPST